MDVPSPTCMLSETRVFDVKLETVFDLSRSLSLALPQPRQTTWRACGVWRPVRSSVSTAATRRPWYAWPSTTVRWADEEEENVVRLAFNDSTLG